MSNSDVNRYVTEILKTYGEYHNPNTTDTGDEEPYIRNERYGLEVRKYWKSKNIVVKYDYATMYNEQEGIYKHGVWEELLEDYYNNIPTMLKNERDRKATQKINNALYGRISSVMLMGNIEKYREPDGIYCHLYTISWFDNGLKIVVDNYDTTKHFVTTRVFYNNEEVFRRVKEETFDVNFVPDENVTYPIVEDGEWLDVLASLEKEKNERTKQKRLENFRKSLD